MLVKKRLWAICFAVVAVAGTMNSCGSKKNDMGGVDNNVSNDFKIGMLTNYADKIIIPAYTDLQNKLGLLETSINTFLSNPTVGNQQSLKPVFKDAYISYEGVSAAYFGPAAALLFNNSANSFPAATGNIESGIQSGNYNFNTPYVSDSIQGMPALDYLLFSNDAVNKFSGPGAANRKKYVTDIMTRMNSLVGNTLSQWQGSYHNSFVNSTKTDMGSSIAYLVNQIAFELDALKGPRIGWPFGKQSGGIVFADKCEGYYSGITAALAVANLKSLKNYYTGGSGNGLADYLVLLKKDQINNDVLAQFDLTLSSLQSIPDPMSEAFTANSQLVDAAYKEVQKLLTLLKTDVPSATGVRISYQDSDGD